MPETSDLFLSAIQRQIKEAAPAIAQALRKGTDIELRVDCYGHLNVISVNKHKLQIKPF